MLRQKFKNLENKKNFKGEIKSIFHQFQRAFSFQKRFQKHDTDTKKKWQRKRKIQELLEIKKANYNKNIKVLNRDENN